MVKRASPCSPPPRAACLRCERGEGLGVGALSSLFCLQCTPTPSPSPQPPRDANVAGTPAGGGEHTEFAACVSRYAIAPSLRGRDEGPQPNTSSVMVLNQPLAYWASRARVELGASRGLTPPEPSTSLSCPSAGA